MSLWFPFGLLSKQPQILAVLSRPLWFSGFLVGLVVGFPFNSLKVAQI